MANRRQRQAPRQNDCSICLDTFKSPKILPCFHSFCLPCLEKLVADDRSFPCPACRQQTIVPVGGVCKFQSNFYINTDDGRNDEDDIEEISNEDLSKMCEKHRGYQLLLYCKLCNRAVCRECGVTSHVDHTVVDLQQEIEAVRSYINEVKRTVQDKAIPEMHQAILDTEASKHQLSEDRNRLKKKIEMRGKKVKDLVTQYVNESLEKLEKLTVTTQIDMDQKLTEMGRQLECIQELSDSLNIGQADENFSEILSTRDAVRNFFHLGRHDGAAISAEAREFNRDPFSVPRFRVFANSSRMSDQLKLSPSVRRASHGMTSQGNTMMADLQKLIRNYIGEVKRASTHAGDDYQEQENHGEGREVYSPPRQQQPTPRVRSRPNELNHLSDDTEVTTTSSFQYGVDDGDELPYPIMPSH